MNPSIYITAAGKHATEKANSPDEWDQWYSHMLTAYLKDAEALGDGRQPNGASQLPPPAPTGYQSPQQPFSGDQPVTAPVWRDNTPFCPRCGCKAKDKRQAKAEGKIKPNAPDFSCNGKWQRNPGGDPPYTQVQQDCGWHSGFTS